MTVIADTGLLVAFLYRRDRYHDWALGVFEDATLPILTCESVLTETAHLIARGGIPRSRAVSLLTTGAVRIAQRIDDDPARIEALLVQYHDQDMDLADACVVHLSEQVPHATVATVDRSDFLVYRRFRTEAIPLALPPIV